MSIFKNETLEERKKKSKDILDKYPNRKPIIVIDNKKQHKFLCLDSHTISVILVQLRKRMEINKYDSIYLFINKQTIPNNTENILSLYKKFKNEDGFLYMEVKKENTFG